MFKTNQNTTNRNSSSMENIEENKELYVQEIDEEMNKGNLNF